MLWARVLALFLSRVGKGTWAPCATSGWWLSLLTLWINLLYLRCTASCHEEGATYLPAKMPRYQDHWGFSVDQKETSFFFNVRITDLYQAKSKYSRYITFFPLSCHSSKNVAFLEKRVNWTHNSSTEGQCTCKEISGEKNSKKRYWGDKKSSVWNIFLWRHDL